MYRIIAVITLYWISFSAIGEALDLQSVREILNQPDEKIDLAYAKLVTDKMIDPSIDIPANIEKLDDMVADIQRLLQRKPLSKTDMMMTLLTYIYDKGFWNNNQIFEYDLDDPYGKDIKTKLLPHYLDTHKGNCVSMPMLLVILAQKLGIDMVLVRAPTHLFTHFTNESGKVFNVEGISKGTISDQRYLKEYYITDDAVKNGIYLQSLSRKQMVAEMLETVAEYYAKQDKYDGVMVITNLILEYDPKAVDAMVHKGATYAHMSDAFLKAHHYKLDQAEDSYMQQLHHNNHFWYAKAESLGWREPPKEFGERYAALIEKAKAERQRNEEVKDDVH
jgi:regulator of sirC expression with transglutaminase-like and TPR domain